MTSINNRSNLGYAEWAVTDQIKTIAASSSSSNGETKSNA